MNIQREAIYKKRKNALSGERMSVDLNNMFLAMTENMVRIYRERGDYDSFKQASVGVIGFDPKMTANEFETGSVDSVIEQYQAEFLDFYERKSQAIREVLMPVIQDVNEHQSHYKLLSVPFTDGRSNPLPIAAAIKPAIAVSYTHLTLPTICSV